MFCLLCRQAAIGYARLSDPGLHFNSNTVRHTAISVMLNCVMEHPYMIYGEGGYCSQLMSCMQGSVFGKRGAGGVYMTGN